MPKPKPKKFDRDAYLRDTKFVPGIDSEIAANEAEEIHNKGKLNLTHFKRNAGRQKPTIKKNKHVS